MYLGDLSMVGESASRVTSWSKGAIDLIEVMGLDHYGVTLLRDLECHSGVQDYGY